MREREMTKSELDKIRDKLADNYAEYPREGTAVKEGFNAAIGLLLPQVEGLSEALKEIRNLPDIDSDHRGVIAREALTKYGIKDGEG